MLSSVADSKGNTWHVDEKATDGTRTSSIASSNLTSSITTSDTVSLTLSAATSVTQDTIMITASGIVSSSPVDQTTSTSGTAATYTVGPTGTLAQSTELGVAFFRTSGVIGGTGQVGGSPAGWTAAPGTAILTSSGMETVSTAATTAVSATWSSGSGNWAGSLVTYKGTSNAPPVNTVAPSLSGTAVVGNQLTTTNGTWTDDGSPTFSYQWYADAQGSNPYSAIGGATTASFTLTNTQDACHVKCTVTDSTPDGNTAADSNILGTVTEPVPVNTAAPTVSGATPVGSTDSTSNGTWNNMGGFNPTFAYKWTRSGTSITGATASTYTTVSADQNTSLGSIVTATNTGGSTSFASSNTIIVTAAAGVATLGTDDPSYLHTIY